MDDIKCPQIKNNLQEQIEKSNEKEKWITSTQAERYARKSKIWTK